MRPIWFCPGCDDFTRVFPAAYIEASDPPAIEVLALCFACFVEIVDAADMTERPKRWRRCVAAAERAPSIYQFSRNWPIPAVTERCSMSATVTTIRPLELDFPEKAGALREARALAEFRRAEDEKAQARLSALEEPMRQRAASRRAEGRAPVALSSINKEREFQAASEDKMRTGRLLDGALANLRVLESELRDQLRLREVSANQASVA